LLTPRLILTTGLGFGLRGAPLRFLGLEASRLLGVALGGVLRLTLHFLLCLLIVGLTPRRILRPSERLVLLLALSRFLSASLSIFLSLASRCILGLLRLLSSLITRGPLLGLLGRRILSLALLVLGLALRGLARGALLVFLRLTDLRLACVI